NWWHAFRPASATKSKASTESVSTSRANRPARSSGSDLIFDCRFSVFDPALESVHLRVGADEFREIFAVARGVIERVEARIHCCLGQRDATLVRSVCKDDFVALMGGILVVETRDREGTG